MILLYLLLQHVMVQTLLLNKVYDDYVISQFFKLIQYHKL